MKVLQAAPAGELGCSATEGGQMAVVVLAGRRFDGVSYGTAPGTDPGHVIGYTPLNGEQLLRVHQTECPGSLYGVKYYHHEAGDARGADRPAEDKIALTILVNQGRWRQRVWSESSGESIEVLLAQPGDYIVWGPNLKHSWYPVEASTMLTVKWSRIVEPSTAADRPRD
jgi:hypothetical protein